VVRVCVPDGGQAVLAVHDLLAGVDQEEAARAVRVLGLAPREAHVAHQRRLLIAQTLLHTIHVLSE
jgi:hypothetical protein